MDAHFSSQLDPTQYIKKRHYTMKEKWEIDGKNNTEAHHTLRLKFLMVE